uniref:Carboxypeptidase Q n=1 Tax=Anoplophora glabripennis TaxID=217634 RepID=V5I8M9_ANOGL
MKIDHLLPLLLCVATVATDVSNNEVDDDVGRTDARDDACDLSAELIAEIAAYQTTANTIINSLTNGKFKGGTYKELTDFVDKFGPRLSGTQNLEDSIDYMLDLLNQYELENVHGEELQVPHWERGNESAQMVSPREAEIAVLALGNSVGTPEEGIEAEVLVVRSFDELDQANFSEAANGKIVVFNNDFVSYGVSVQYRSQGARRAAIHGAVAALVRSVAPFSLYTLHTGTQSYGTGTQIPSLSITIEDAKMFQRYQDRGEKIVLRLKSEAQTFNDSTSRNTVAEVEGSDEPEKVVLVSGHLDSWDVGVGAMDDGGGAFISWYALAVLKSLGIRAKRTLRAVLWTSEELGLVGAYAYDRDHADELDNITFVMESDEGTFTPLGLEYNAGTRGGCIIQEIMKLLAPINATQTEYSSSGVGSDISIWANIIPGGSLLNANDRYFWYHHTEADTMDVMDPDNLDKATALFAVVSYVIADLSEEFPRDFDTLTANAAKSALIQKLQEGVASNKLKKL